MNRRCMVGLLLTLLCLSPSAHASHDTDYGSVVQAVAILPMAGFLPINAIDAAQQQGRLWKGIVGIGLGTLQTWATLQVYYSSAVADRTSTHKALMITNTILGVAGIGAGIFAITRRGGNAVAFAPYAISTSGPAPGISVTLR